MFQFLYLQRTSQLSFLHFSHDSTTTYPNLCVQFSIVIFIVFLFHIQAYLSRFLGMINIFREVLEFFFPPSHYMRLLYRQQIQQGIPTKYCLPINQQCLTQGFSHISVIESTKDSTPPVLLLDNFSTRLPTQTTTHATQWKIRKTKYREYS